MHDTFWPTLCAHIAEITGDDARPGARTSVGGGCINDAHRLQCGANQYFIKTNHAGKLDMFIAEAQGLQALASSETLRVPQPICWGTEQEQAYLVLENLSLGGEGSQARLGEQLAALHGHTGPRYGWERHNTIGSTPQMNTPDDSWVDFWRHHRLGYQLNLAGRNGYGGRLQSLGDQVLERFPVLFHTYTPTASMLHGDLWSGNYSFTQQGEPVIFDPAFYYGDRETDLAMMELFGGFSRECFAAYRSAYPVDEGYGVRKRLYQLYHILNHANLFGGGYASQAESIMASLLSELR